MGDDLVKTPDTKTFYNILLTEELKSTTCITLKSHYTSVKQLVLFSGL